MYKFMAVFLIFLKILVIFLKSPLIFGLVILQMCVCMCFMTMSLVSSWFSLIFFLVYMGGILVLIFYTLIFKSKPKLVIFNLKLVVLIGFCSLMFFWFFPKNLLMSSWEFMGLELWYLKEMAFVLGILNLLLMVLWIITKLKFTVKNAFRPIY